MSKQYGLIVPGKQKSLPQTVTRAVPQRSVFESDSSDGNEEAPPMQMKMKAAPLAPGSMERKLARQQQEKALAEDPTIFQYDELYDDMNAKREDQKSAKSNEPKQAKYIGRLKECAERRKLENERRIERQVQKEREQEGDEFKDKESFVTTAYRKKLEEIKQMEEKEKRDDYLEAIGDVTKQNDLDGFYRHLYEVKVGTVKEVVKPELPKDVEEVGYQPIKSTANAPKRAYRKRLSSDEEEDDANQERDAIIAAKKAHLTNNIDADSDFSIDSSDEDSDNDDEKTKGKSGNPQSKMDIMDPRMIAINVNAMRPLNDSDDASTSEENKDESDFDEMVPEKPEEPAPKKDKSEIWKKRTVGEAFDAAVRRYFERKAAKQA